MVSNKYNSNRKNILIYATGFQGHQEIDLLDEAIKYHHEGHNVFYINCDKSMRGCYLNPHFNSTFCSFCSRIQKSNNKRYLPDGIKQYSVKDFLNKEILSKAENTHFEYNNLKELKSTTYSGVEIGYGAVSTYVSLTRNIYPLINDQLKNYINALLVQQVILSEVGELLIKNFSPDLILVHNGRFAQYKPILGLAQKYGINYICTEGYRTSEGIVYKRHFKNAIVHDILANHNWYIHLWEKSNLSIEEKRELGKKFFENKKNNIWAGDKIYTKNQEIGALPENWNNKIENICIFNSSEDEFFSVSKEFDKSSFFKTQFEGIETIVKHYADDKTKHFYLRIHPNLSAIKYKYHQDLYKLNYPNLSVINPNSSISTYSMIEGADKVIVFGSTVGIEAVYWGKPVICLGAAFYNLMDVVYVPQNEKELWDFINNIKLPCKYNENVLKFGYFYMSDCLPKYNFLEHKEKELKIGKYPIKLLPAYKFLGSRRLHYMIYTICSKLSKKNGFFSAFKRIPDEEEISYIK